MENVYFTKIIHFFSEYTCKFNTYNFSNFVFFLYFPIRKILKNAYNRKFHLRKLHHKESLKYSLYLNSSEQKYLED